MAVEDVFDDVFFDTFDKDRSRRRRGTTTRDGVRECGSEFYYGEDVVKLSKGRREFEFVRSFSDLSFDCVRTQAAMSEFSGGARSCKGTYPSDPSDPPPLIPTASATSVYISLSYYRLTFISLFILIFTLRSDPPSDPPCPIRRTLSCPYIHPPFYIHLSYDIYLYYFQNLLQPALE